MEIADRFSKVANENPPNENFLLGAKNGQIVTHVLSGKVSEEGMEIVDRAKREAVELGRTDDIIAIQMIVWRELFEDAVVDRLGVSKVCGQLD